MAQMSLTEKGLSHKNSDGKQQSPIDREDLGRQVSQFKKKRDKTQSPLLR